DAVGRRGRMQHLAGEGQPDGVETQAHHLVHHVLVAARPQAMRREVRRFEAICTEWPAASMIWLPDVLSQPGAAEVAPAVPSITDVSDMLSPGNCTGGGATSSFTMVPIAVACVMVAPFGEARFSVSVSFPSTAV